MIFKIDRFQTEEWCIDDLEAAYATALRQQQNLVIKIGTETYAFSIPMEREHRIKRWKRLYQENKPP